MMNDRTGAMSAQSRQRVARGGTLILWLGRDMADLGIFERSGAATPAFAHQQGGRA